MGKVGAVVAVDEKFGFVTGEHLAHGRLGGGDGAQQVSVELFVYI